MLCDALIAIGNKFPSARLEQFSGHSLADYLRRTGPAEVSDALGELGHDAWKSTYRAVPRCDDRDERTGIRTESKFCPPAIGRLIIYRN